MNATSRLSGSAMVRPGLWLTLFILVMSPLCEGQTTAPSPQRRSRRRAASVKVVLPKPRTQGALSLEELLVSQGPLQMPASTPLDVAEIGQLAWAAQGVHVDQEQVTGGNDPTAGLELFFVTADGLFQYVPRGHYLEQLSAVDARAALVLAAQGQAGQMVGCGILICRATGTRGPRENNRMQRVLNLRVGHMAQILKLQATALGLVTLDAVDFNLLEFRRSTRLAREVEPLHVLLVGYRPDRAAAANDASTDLLVATPAEPLVSRGKAVLMIASKGFRDEELFTTARVLNAGGIDTAIAANRLGAARGMMGGVVQATVPFSDLSVEAYDALVLIGGNGSNELDRNARVASLLREALLKKKIVAATSETTGILARIDAIKGVRVTGYPSKQQALTEAGGICTGLSVEIDGSIITASGPAASPQFGQAIVEGIAAAHTSDTAEGP